MADMATTTLSTAELVPEILQKAALDVQEGRHVRLGLLLALFRSGVVRRQSGQWILSTLGVQAAALARNRRRSPAEAAFTEDAKNMESQKMGKSDMCLTDLIDPEQLMLMTDTLGISMDDLCSAFEQATDDCLNMTGSVDGDLSVTKQADGSYRWVLISSSAYQDVDREIVSKRALTNDVVRADKDRDFGPLVWWHSKSAVLGTCDYNAMVGPGGRFLVESGVFHDPEVAEAVQRNKDRLGVSIGFDYYPSQRDESGVFWGIRRKERSLLPRGRASNQFTIVSVNKESSEMDTYQKYQEFVALFPTLEQGHAVALRLGQQVAALDQAAQAAKVANKEAGGSADQAPATETTNVTPDIVAQNAAVANSTTTASALESTDKAASDYLATRVEKMFTDLSAQLTGSLTKALEDFDQRLNQLATTKEAATNTENEALLLRLQQAEATVTEMQKQVASLNSGLPPMAQMFLGSTSGGGQAPAQTPPAQSGQKSAPGQPIDPFISAIFGAI